MTSQKQIEANRRNALKSTGPRSAEGKARVARNALKHGLLSHDMLIMGENAEELELFREAMMADLAPEGHVEVYLADRMVSCAWRLRRAGQLERDIINGKMLDEVRSRARSPQAYVGVPDPMPGPIAAETLWKEDTYDKISRYERYIEHGLYKALHELQRLQAVRRGEGVTAPAAVDVDVSGQPAVESVGVSDARGREVTALAERVGEGDGQAGEAEGEVGSAAAALADGGGGGGG